MNRHYTRLLHRIPAILLAAALLVSCAKDYPPEPLGTFAKTQTADCMTERACTTHFYVAEEDGTAVGCGAIGLDDRGEGIVGSMDFYAVFVAEIPMTVYHDGVEIGSIDRAYRPGDCFFLGGRSWEVVERDMGRKRLDVTEADEEAEVQFTGGGRTPKRLI